MGRGAPVAIPQGLKQRWGLKSGAARPSPLRSESVSEAFACVLNA